MDKFMKELNLDVVEKTIETVPLGTKASFSKTVTEGDVILYAGITGSFEPVCMNEGFARESPALGRSIQRLLLATYTWPVSTMITSPGSVTVGQQAVFYKDVRIGDTIFVTGEVTEKREEKKLVFIHMEIRNQNHELVMEGKVTNMMRVR